MAGVEHPAAIDSSNHLGDLTDSKLQSPNPLLSSDQGGKSLGASAHKRPPLHKTPWADLAAEMTAKQQAAAKAAAAAPGKATAGRKSPDPHGAVATAVDSQIHKYTITALGVEEADATGTHGKGATGAKAAKGESSVPVNDHIITSTFSLPADTPATAGGQTSVASGSSGTKPQAVAADVAHPADHVYDDSPPLVDASNLIGDVQQHDTHTAEQQTAKGRALMRGKLSFSKLPLDALVLTTRQQAVQLKLLPTAHAGKRNGKRRLPKKQFIVSKKPVVMYVSARSPVGHRRHQHKGHAQRHTPKGVTIKRKVFRMHLSTAALCNRLGMWLRQGSGSGSSSGFTLSQGARDSLACLRERMMAVSVSGESGADAADEEMAGTAATELPDDLADITQVLLSIAGFQPATSPRGTSKGGPPGGNTILSGNTADGAAPDDAADAAEVPHTTFSITHDSSPQRKTSSSSNGGSKSGNGRVVDRWAGYTNRQLKVLMSLPYARKKMGKVS